MKGSVPGWLRGARVDRQRLAWILGSLAIGAVVLGAAWIVITGLVARSHLNHVKSELHALRQAVAAGNTTNAKALVDDISEQAGSAHALTSGPAWWVTSNIPVLGTPLQTSRTIALQADRLGQQVLPAVQQLADDLAKTPPPTKSTIDLAPITDAAPALDRAAKAVHSAVMAIDGAKPSWLPYVSSARTSVAKELRGFDGELTGASRAVNIVLPMLGESGKQRYFIGFLNEAESRGVGGIPGAFAIATADHGKITFERFGSDDDLHKVRADVNLGAEYNARYHQDDPTGVIQNSDISPDFRDAAQIWAGMWQKKTGEHIDGAIAIDPTALSYLLKVTGPAALGDGTSVAAGNVVALTQQKQYALFRANTQHDKSERKKYLISVAKAVSDRLTQGGNAQHLVKALSHAARERRLVVWSAQPAIEDQLEVADWAGALDAPTGTPFAGFVVNNGSGGKIDYYLHRTTTYTSTGCANGRAAVATFTLRNGAPATGLPDYVTTRVDKAPTGARPGSEALIVTYYATPGATISRVTVDGRPVAVVSLPDNGLVTANMQVEMAAGATHTVRVLTREPKSTAPAVVLHQPLVNPMRVSTRTAACS